MNSEQQNQLYGIDRDIFDRFMFLIKDRYTLVDEAVFLIENTVGTSGLSVGLTNQRDVLSHLATVLSKADLNRDEVIAHVNQAEEHLRRAFVELFGEAVSLMSKKIDPVVDSYKSLVLPLLPHDNLPGAPDSAEIRDKFQLISSLRTESRTAKGRNSWEGAEESVKYSSAALFRLKELKDELEQLIPNATQIKQNKRQTLIGIWALIATLVALALAIMAMVG